MSKIILIVDDDASIRILFRLTLQSAGFAVKEATNGLDAISVLQMEPVDAIITDLDMPKVDGASAIDTFVTMRHGRDIPIIVATGASDPAIRERAAQSGAVAVLSKPISPDQLLQTLREHVPDA